MAQRVASRPGMSARYFYGWNVVGATFVMALFSFGLGFYGLAVYVATLQRLYGWSASAVSAPVTVYYLCGALLTASIGDLYERFGPRVVVAGGSIAMAAGVAGLGIVTQPWHLYPTFVVMSVGWGAMSGAAINIILAPWFQRRRGLAVSVAFNGATLGGVIVTPALILLVGVAGFTRALAVAAVVLLVVLLALAAAVMGRLVTGLVVDRLNRRLVSSATLVIQIAGLAILSWAPSAMVVYAGCALFGLGVGNLTTLPGLILAVEWPREQFSSLVGLVVGINQFTFAFGPSLVGVMRDWTGMYAPALGACMVLQLVAAAMILLGPGPSRSPGAVEHRADGGSPGSAA